MIPNPPQDTNLPSSASRSRISSRILNKHNNVKVVIHSLNYVIIHLKILLQIQKSMSPKWPKCVFAFGY